MVQLSEKTLAQLCLEASRQYGEHTAFAMFQDDKLNEDRRVSYKMLGFRARQIALLLKQLGVASGDRVLLLSENCPEWPLAYFGIALSGTVSVPLLTGFSANQVQHIMGHAEVSAIIASRRMAGKIEQIPPGIPLIFLDSITTSENSAEIAVSSNGSEKRLPLPTPNGELPQCKSGDLATIIYTSGTSGNSKGVMLSNANLIACVESSLFVAKFSPADRWLSVLPLAHSYECSIGMLYPVMSGSSVTYLDRPPSPSVLLTAARLVRPTAMLTVPLLIEKIYRSGIGPKLQSSSLYRFPLTRPLATRVAGRKLNAALGGKIRFFGIGGAPLAAEVEQFLRGARFPYAMGYGLTEAAPLLAGGAPFTYPYRSTGALLPGVELRIAPRETDTDGANADIGVQHSVDSGSGAKGPGAERNAAFVGEIQARGPNVMMGYYRNEEQTREAYTDDGWLRTGDLGRIDSNNKLFICGRSKFLILGSGGENIYPEEIEGLLGSSPSVEDALVYSGGNGELVAMVKLTDAAKAAAGNMEQTLEELRTWANKKLANFSRLSKITIRHEPFEKTPTMKIKRRLYI